MKRLSALALSLLLLGTVPAVAQKAPAKAKDGGAAKTVVAVVEGERIYRRDVEIAFRTLPANVRRHGLDKVYERVLEMLIERKMMTIYARRERYDQDQEVKRRLGLAEDQIVREVYMDRLIKKYLTEDRVRAHYDDYVRKNPAREEIRARHILLESESKANEMVEQARSGQDFAQLASKNSVGPSAQRGGDLGYFTAGEMVKPFSDAAFKLKKGQVTPAPVKTQFGWHVIKVEDRRTREIPPYEKVRDRMEREVWVKLGEDFLRQYREQAKVQRFSIDGKKKLPALPANAKAAGGNQ